MKTDRPHGLRVSPQTIRSWLDRLDRHAQPLAGLDQRMSRRFDYRPPTLTLEVAQDDDATVPYAAAGRNISRGGVGLLAGQFVYPQATCWVELNSTFGGTQKVAGRIARCRYLVGSGSLYEVGVEFDAPLDVSLFAPQARHVQMLLVWSDAATQELIAGFLGSENVELRTVAAGEDALAALAGARIDLVLIDLDHPNCDGFALTRELRRDGYVAPIFGMTVQADPQVRDRCTEAGCTGYLVKPVRREQLHALLDSLQDRPLVSPLASDPGLAPLIDRFVAGLRDKVAALSRAGETGDLAALSAHARELRAQAGSYGFDAITDEAAYLQALLAAETPPAQIRHALHRLIDVCLRARPATSPPEPGPAAHARPTETA